MAETTVLIHFPNCCPPRAVRPCPACATWTRAVLRSGPRGALYAAGSASGRARRRPLAGPGHGLCWSVRPGALRAADAAAKAPGADPYGDPVSAIVGELAALEGLGGAAPAGIPPRARTPRACGPRPCCFWPGSATRAGRGPGVGRGPRRRRGTPGRHPGPGAGRHGRAGRRGRAGRTPPRGAYAEPGQWQPVLAPCCACCPQGRCCMWTPRRCWDFWREAGVPLEPVAGAALDALLPGAGAGRRLLARCRGACSWAPPAPGRRALAGRGAHRAGPRGRAGSRAPCCCAPISPTPGSWRG
jgi:hypothetical protein